MLNADIAMFSCNNFSRYIYVQNKIIQTATKNKISKNYSHQIPNLPLGSLEFTWK